MQITEAKLEANRQNSQLSTGPTTPEGKATSARNSLKHGLSAKNTVLLSTESQADLDTLADGMRHDFDPYNTTEHELLDQLIDLQWRLRRAGRCEAEILSADAPDFKALHNMSLHAARLKRQFSTTLKEFQSLHAAEAAQITANLQRAEIIQKADQLLDRPSTLADHGFDFSIAYLEKWSNRRNAFQEAERAVTRDKFAAQLVAAADRFFAEEDANEASQVDAEDEATEELLVQAA